jgi:hypothetical protein
MSYAERISFGATRRSHPLRQLLPRNHRRLENQAGVVREFRFEQASSERRSDVDVADEATKQQRVEAQDASWSMSSASFHFRPQAAS